MDTCLVTGGAGFIGANFIKYMIETYGGEIRLIVLDNLTYAGNLETLKKELPLIEFIKGDICDQSLVTDLFCKASIDCVVNFAAESHVDRSIQNPGVFLRTNALGTQNLLDCAMKSWLAEDGTYKCDAKFLQVSTDEVYGSLGDTGSFTEQTPLSPRSPYSASKASADLMVRAYVETYRFPAIVTRCSNNYGPYQFPEKLIPLAIKNILEGKSLPVYGDGTHVRDWIYVLDHVKAIDMVLKKGKIGQVYNIGGQNEKQNIEMVKLVIDQMVKMAKSDSIHKKAFKNDVSAIGYHLITFVADRKGHDRRYSMDSGKIAKELGWTPETCLKEGIEKTIRWYLENQDWLAEISSRPPSN